jgi:hypothetical protein
VGKGKEAAVCEGYKEVKPPNPPRGNSLYSISNQRIYKIKRKKIKRKK